MMREATLPVKEAGRRLARKNAVDWGVAPYMAVSGPVPDDAPEAEARIPTDWLMPILDLDMVRGGQRPDTQASLTSEALTLAGIELRIERRWIRETYWKQIKESVGKGYIYRSSPVEVILRGERRTRRRLPRGRRSV